jgi:hypothetical protein
LESVAAGYVDRDASDKIGIARRQKANHLGLIRRLGDAPQRCALDLGGLVLPLGFGWDASLG